MEEKAVCLICGKEFEKKYLKSRCCSRKCSQELYREERRTYYKKVCPICGVEFETSKPRVVYCSIVCRCEANRIYALKYAKHVVHAPRLCEYCGKEYVPKSNSSKYCSEECKKIAQVQNPKRFDPRSCVICGKEFVPRGSTAKYCGEECRQESIRRALKENRYEYKKEDGIEKKKKKSPVSDYPDVPSSRRWEKMNLAERSKECTRYHLTYGQAQGRAYGGKLPEDFGLKRKDG